MLEGAERIAYLSGAHGTTIVGDTQGGGQGPATPERVADLLKKVEAVSCSRTHTCEGDKAQATAQRISDMVATMSARRTYRRSALVRAEEALMRVLVPLGILPHTYLLEVRGARTGKLRTVSVTLVENGDRWLVAPYGARAWVGNVRASRVGRLRRGRYAADVRFEEAGPEEAAPVLQRYWRLASATRPYFDVGASPELEDFQRVAASHPVFRVLG